MHLLVQINFWYNSNAAMWMDVVFYLAPRIKLYNRKDVKSSKVVCLREGENVIEQRQMEEFQFKIYFRFADNWLLGRSVPG